MSEARETWDTTGPVKRKSQFSIRNLLFWPAIVSVGVVITTSTLSDVKRLGRVRAGLLNRPRP
jgi:hypothetical protein